MADVQAMPAEMDPKERTLLARYETARRQAQEALMRRRGTTETGAAVVAARPEGEYTPLWVANAMERAWAHANREYQNAMEAEVTALAELSRYADGKIGTLQSEAADLAAGKAAAVPDWKMSNDQSKWTALLPDGRMAVVERLDDGVSFLPRISAFGKEDEEAAGPVFDGLLAAAQWVTAQVAQ